GQRTLHNKNELTGGGGALPVTAIPAEPAGANTSLTNTGGDAITLAQGNTVKGFTIGNTSGTKIINTAATTVGTATISNVTLQGSGADVLIGSGGALAMTFDSLSSTSSTSAVSLTNATGTFTASAGAITGATGNAFPA